MPYLLVAVAVGMLVMLVVAAIRGRVRVSCCAVLPPIEDQKTEPGEPSSATTGRPAASHAIMPPTTL
jgi:hypothetical protein